jgi:hypothetical protein
MALSNLAVDHRIKASKKNARSLNARQRRAALKKTVGEVHISSHYERRTLTGAARKQIEKERAPQLWIFPWMDQTHVGGDRGRRYPQASLLGLPTELRQHVLHLSYSMNDLVLDTEVLRDARIQATKRTGDLRKRGSTAPATSMTEAMLDRFHLQPHEGDLVTVLRRKIGELSRVSPLIRDDMQYVGKRWQTDLELHLDKPKLRVVSEGHAWLHATNATQPYPKKKKGAVVQGKKSGPCKKVRPPKCWDCTERHAIGDQVCPMARRDPEKWQKMTRKLGGRRGRSRVKPTFIGTKVDLDT